MLEIVLSVLVVCGIVLILVAVLVVTGHLLGGSASYRVCVNGSRAFAAERGQKLLSVLARNRVFLPSACGGGGTCGHCKCRIPEGGGHVLETEKGLLSREELRAHYRLACQVKVREDMNIHLPDQVFQAAEYVCEVVSNHNVATFIKELVLRPPDSFKGFRAGEYVQLTVPEYELLFRGFEIDAPYRAHWQQQGLLDLRAANDEEVVRAYSIASYPREPGGIRFNVRAALPPPGKKKCLPGRASSYLFFLKPGDKVSLSGPYGEFLIRESGREMVYIGGGAGMAPLRSHLGDLFFNRRTQRKVSFWYGARSAKELLYDEEFRKLACTFSNFRYEAALSAALPEDDWSGEKGLIHEVVLRRYLQAHPAPEECEYYLCGPALMAGAVMAMLDGLGVPRQMISCDNFG